MAIDLKTEDEIARIVKETLNALDGRRAVVDEYDTEAARSRSCAHLRNVKDVLVVRMELPHAWVKSHDTAFAHEKV